MTDPTLRFDEFLDLLKTLIHQPSVVGWETPFFRTIRRELEEMGIEVSLFEGLLVAKGSCPDEFFLSAHVDRHGLVCTGPGEFQYAAFVAQNRADQLGDSVSENTFRTVSSRLDGEAVLAYEPWSGAYLDSGTITGSYLCPRRDNMVFEVPALAHLIPGVPVAFRDRLRVRDGWIEAQLDNVLSVAFLIHLFRLGFRGTAFFSAQEEAGRSWRFLLDWFRRLGRGAQNLIVLDTSPFPDRESAAAQQVVLRNRDANGQFSPPLVERLEGICKSRSVSYIFKDRFVEEANTLRAAEGKKPLSLGRTELGRIVAASEGNVQGATLQIPTTGYHTPSETTSLAACRSFLEILAELALDRAPG